MQTILNWLLEALGWIWDKLCGAAAWLWDAFVNVMLAAFHLVTTFAISCAHEAVAKLDSIAFPGAPDMGPLTALGDTINTFFPLNETITMIAVLAGVLVICTCVKILRLLLRCIPTFNT